jgi:hypothetical protein
MKKALLASYIFFCTGGTYAQQRQNVVVAEVDFNRPAALQFVQYRSDTVRATLLITRGHMQMAHEKPGYVVYRTKDTIYLDDRKIQLKAPVKVWATKIEKP